MSALYLHIPFCLCKCHYCSFNSRAGGQELYGPYVEALLLELTRLAEKNRTTAGRPGLDTLFVGGGTPTCLPSELLQRAIRFSLDLFGVRSGAEISVEANPGTVDSRYLQLLVEAGANRLSLGVQSFDDRELGLIGRIHNKEQACAAFTTARAAGFHNINLDLMYGLPGQTPDSWRKSLEQGLQLGAEHLSLYQLTIEPDTLFYSSLQSNTLSFPGEEEILEMDEITQILCNSARLHQYETSNYAVKGRQCRHNINYWRNNDYLAAGASAVSCLQGVRERRVGDPDEYIRRLRQHESIIIERECLDREESFRETVIMGLRMVQGVSCAALHERYGYEVKKYYGLTLKKLLDLGLVELTGSHLRITPKGWPLSNRIMAELV
jgi:oxygen-independent coproporphyrinogen-3 oxidase